MEPPPFAVHDHRTRPRLRPSRAVRFPQYGSSRPAAVARLSLCQPTVPASGQLNRWYGMGGQPEASPDVAPRPTMESGTAAVTSRVVAPAAAGAVRQIALRTIAAVREETPGPSAWGGPAATGTPLIETLTGEGVTT